METIKKEGAILDVSILDGHTFTLTLGGDVSTENHRAELEAWEEKTKETILQLKKKSGGTIYGLVDISTLNTFDEGSVDIVKNLASFPEASDIKTAVIGGSLLSKMALRTIVYVSKRDNIKSFDSREEALTWLRG